MDGRTEGEVAEMEIGIASIGSRREDDENDWKMR